MKLKEYRLRRRQYFVFSREMLIVLLKISIYLFKNVKYIKMLNSGV